MDLALVTILAGLLSAWPWLAERSAVAQIAWRRIEPALGACGAALMAYGAYHLLVYVLPEAEAFGYAPMLYVACAAGLVLDIVIGFRLALPALARLLQQRASDGLGDLERYLARRETLLGALAVTCGLATLLSM